MIYMGAASANQTISGRAGGLPRRPGRDPSSLPSPACCGHRQAPRPHPWEAQKHVHLGTRPCSTGDLGSLTAGSVPGGRSWDTEVLEECPLGRDTQMVFQPRRQDQGTFCEEGGTAVLSPHKGAELLATASRGPPTSSSEVDSPPLSAGQNRPGSQP